MTKTKCLVSGAGYTVASLQYARSNWSVGLGSAARLYGQDCDDQLQSFYYLQGAYSYSLSAATDLRLSGYVGTGSTDDEDEPVTLGEINAAIYHDFSDGVTAHFGVSSFVLESDSYSTSRGNGFDISLGVLLAVGGTGQEARQRIMVDVPDFHREFSWACLLKLPCYYK